MAKNCGLYNWLLGIGVEARLLLKLAGLGVDSLPLPKRLRAGTSDPCEWLVAMLGATNREKLQQQMLQYFFHLRGGEPWAKLLHHF
jgi:hypothetical protein